MQTNRLDWNMKTLVQAYQDIGNTDQAWDKPAIQALTEFARSRSLVLDPDEPWAEIIATNCGAAINAGCDDPMIRYLYIKCSMSQTNTPRAFSDAFDDVESNMQESQYPGIRKFYVSLRAYQQFTYTYGYGQNVDFTEGYQLLDDILTNLVASLNDKTMPPNEIYDACSETINTLPGGASAYQDYCDQIERSLSDNWPDESVAWLLKGQADIQVAWRYRGNGYADSVSQDNWKSFAENLNMAEKALNRAWDLDPTDARIAESMISVELGQGKGRDRMELWFNRAMKDDPNDYDACADKLNYLLPQWYGSEQDMVDFGRECVTNTDWGGSVPLILIDAHYDIDHEYTNETDRMDYWKQPIVWNDISSAYEQYFQNNPDDDGRMAYYARYAYYAEQWGKLNELLPKVRPEYYYLFGGTDKFDQIAQLTKSNASRH